MTHRTTWMCLGNQMLQWKMQVTRNHRLSDAIYRKCHRNRQIHRDRNWEVAPPRLGSQEKDGEVTAYGLGYLIAGVGPHSQIHDSDNANSVTLLTALFLFLAILVTLPSLTFSEATTFYSWSRLYQLSFVLSFWCVCVEGEWAGQDSTNPITLDL